MLLNYLFSLPSPQIASITDIIMLWFPNKTPIPPSFSAHSLEALISDVYFCGSLTYTQMTSCKG